MAVLKIKDALGNWNTINTIKGDNGQDGEDGFSPQISTSKSGKTTTITIVDSQGTHTATILDGEDGQGSGNMHTSTYDPAGGARQVAFANELPTKTSDLTNDGDGTNAFLTEHQSLADYSTTAQMNSAISEHHDSTKQNVIDSTHKLDYSLLSNTPTIPTVPTNLSSFTDDLGSSPTHTHSQYLTEHQDITGKESTSNKVTSFQATPDDTHYPSEKLVKDSLDAKASTSHTHSASDISTGTLGGKVTANATAVATLDDSQVRNIYAGTSDMTAGTSILATGDIYVVYEA